MSTHPNVMLQLVLTPLDPEFDVFKYFGWAPPEDNEDSYPELELDFEMRIGERGYTATVFTRDVDEYNVHWQINGKVGQVVLHCYLTYGYGETIPLDTLINHANVLSAWVAQHSAHFNWDTRIGANYW